MVNKNTNEKRALCVNKKKFIHFIMMMMMTVIWAWSNRFRNYSSYDLLPPPPNCVYYTHTFVYLTEIIENQELLQLRSQENKKHSSTNITYDDDDI